MDRGAWQATVHGVLDYLHSLQARGVQKLAVDDDARGILRNWMLAAKRGYQPAPVPMPLQPEQAEPSAAGEPESSPKLDVDLSEPVPAEPQVQEEEIPFFRPGGSNAEEAWANMRRLLPAWAPLRQLGTLREKAVLPQGNTKTISIITPTRMKRKATSATIQATA